MHCLWPFSAPWGESEDGAPWFTEELWPCWRDQKSWKRKETLWADTELLDGWVDGWVDGSVRWIDSSEENGTKGKNHMTTMMWTVGQWEFGKSLMPKPCSGEFSCTPAVNSMINNFYFIITIKLCCQNSAGQLCVVLIDITLHYVLFYVSPIQKHMLWGLFLPFFFSFSVVMKERKQGGHMHRLRVREKLLLSMIGSHFLWFFFLFLSTASFW